MDPTGAPGAPTGTGEPTGDPTPPADPTGQAPEPDGEPQDVSSLPQWAQDTLKKARADAGKHRTGAKTANDALTAAKNRETAMLKALGITPDGDQAPDPQQLAAQVADYQAKAWEGAMQASILRVAGKAGADADALLDSTSFLDSLGDFVGDDPGSADARTKLAAHIAEFVKDRPKLRATAGPARSGGEFPGGTGAGTPITEAQLAGMTPDAIAKAYEAGKLTHLM